MASANTLDTASGMFKDVFGTVQDIRPEGTPVLNHIKFDKRNKLGEKYSEPVWLTDEQGFTYDAGTGTDFTLEDSVAAESKEATLSGAEIVLKTTIAYKPLSAAVEGGKQAFEKFMARRVVNMRKGFMKRLCMTMTYGGNHIGALSAISGSSTARTVTLTEASFAYGFWTGAKGAKLDAYTSAGTKINTTGAITISAAPDIKNRKLSLSGAAADFTAIVTASTDTRFYWRSAYGNECSGVRSIAGLASGSSYLGIAASSYPDLWVGTQVAVGSANLTWDKIQDGLEEAAGKGCETDLYLEVPLPAWSNLNSDVSALRAIDSGYNKKMLSIGTEGIEYHSVTGKVTVVPSRYVMNGESLAYPMDGAKRVGSTDMTFGIPGLPDEQLFRVTGTTASVEFQAYSDQALWTTRPRDFIVWTGLVNS